MGLEESAFKGRYKLKEINQEEWDYLLTYSYMNDINNTHQGDFCFNANPERLIAIDKADSFVKFTITTLVKIDKVVLLWHIPQKYDRKFY